MHATQWLMCHSSFFPVLCVNPVDPRPTTCGDCANTKSLINKVAGYECIATTWSCEQVDRHPSWGGSSPGLDDIAVSEPPSDALLLSISPSRDAICSPLGLSDGAATICTAAAATELASDDVRAALGPPSSPSLPSPFQRGAQARLLPDASPARAGPALTKPLLPRLPTAPALSLATLPLTPDLAQPVLLASIEAAATSGTTHGDCN